MQKSAFFAWQTLQMTAKTPENSLPAWQTLQMIGVTAENC
jgi:hypothetical protein